MRHRGRVVWGVGEPAAITLESEDRSVCGVCDDDACATQLRPPNTPSLFSSALVSGFGRRFEAHIPNKWKCTHARGGRDGAV